MNGNLATAKLFFDACETGKGWSGCHSYCKPDASFSSQTGALADIDSLEAYCEWMKNLLTPVPDGHYELKFFAEDTERGCVAAFAVFHGTQTGPGGPGEPPSGTFLPKPPRAVPWPSSATVTGFSSTYPSGSSSSSSTGKTIAADYVYVMDFDGESIGHMTKIWNDTISLQQLGWA